MKSGLCRYGPRIVVRSIRPIKQGEEVCITYTDLLQPKELRHSDLWSKYRFICCCKRCSAYPEMYVDHILCDTTFLNNEDLNSDRRHLRDMEIEEPADILDQAVTEYLSTGDTEACRSYIENMLTKCFRNEWPQLAESSQTRCKLQPLHFVSLKAFIMLASIYRTQACELETSNHSEEGIPEVFDLNRAMAAYSLLLAGATHHLFLFEPSLIVTTALFWINAGESFLVLVRSLICSPEIKWVNLSEFNIIFCNGRSIMTCIDGSSLPCNEFQSTSLRFLDCVLRISSKVWLFMVSGIQCLTDVKSPIDFSCLGKKNVSHQILVREGVAAGPCHFGNEECVCIGCKCEAEVHAEEGIKNLYQLAIHCLVYGGYLSTICYGCQSYWINHVRKLLCGEAWS
uniref:Protein SET DOMAIN GROUP 41 n=1 Tax=Anthurium amnicola TaxID=1678845 RepID=A0A1D1XMT9_9ARAE